MPNDDHALREHVARLLDWNDAHVTFDVAVRGLPPEYYGEQPADLPYSPWQLLEHIRITQHDIVEFCRNPDHVSPDWPDGYWPDDAAPPSARDWAESIVQIRADRMAMQELVGNDDLNLLGQIPHGDGQTYFREAVLLADHTAYHVGQLVTVRRLLGAWPPPGR